MATVGSVINRALQIARIVGLGDEPTHTESEYALNIYNEMMFAWELDGINLAHITQEVSDTIDVPDSHLETIRLSLAERIAGSFGRSLDPQDMKRAEDGRSALRAYHFSIADLGSDNPLSRENLSNER